MYTIAIFLLISLFPILANANVCDSGYFLDENGECILCRSVAYYCPGDDNKYPCPITDTDYSALSGFQDVTNIYKHDFFHNDTISTNEWTWGGSTTVMKTVYNCRGRILYMNDDGNAFLTESSWNGTNYYSATAVERGLSNFWFWANDGFYLSDWTQKWSSSDLYHAVKPCTNAPQNSHYTGPGTPDSADGTIIDANDCPWECDTGYGRTENNTCEPLCTMSITKLKTSNGLSYNIYAGRHTIPSIHLLHNNTVCYVNLELGTTTNAIHIQHNNSIYHVTN